jgi:hypothetical protein
MGGAVVSPFGYYISPYGGTVGSETNLRLNCVDFFHDVDVGQQWDATKVNLLDAINNESLLLYTRAGKNSFEYPGVHHLDMVLEAYEEAAWLSAHVPINPGANTITKNKTIAIQTAIWALVDETEYNTPGHCHSDHPDYQTCVPNDKRITFDPSADTTSTGYWIAQAKSVVQQKLVPNSYYGAFNIITDLHALNDGVPATYGDKSAQEFLYMTPEPSTWALMGTGLLALGGVAVRRRKRDTEGDPSEDVPVE